MNKVAIITGANRGLGKALADIALADRDCTVVSLSRTLNEDHAAVYKDRLLFEATDLCEPFSAGFISRVKEILTQETVIYLFNNAGTILPLNRIGNFTAGQIETSIKVNIQYPVALINEVISRFPDNKVVLVNITSGAGNNAIAHWSLYGASKAYMKLFMKVLEEENKDNPNVILHSIDPGVLDTGMQEIIRNNDFPNKDYFVSLKEENKLVRPEDAAARILKTISF